MEGAKKANLLTENMTYDSNNTLSAFFLKIETNRMRRADELHPHWGAGGPNGAADLKLLKQK